MTSTPVSTKLNVPIADLLKDYEVDESKVQRIAFRTFKPALEVVPHDPAWAGHFRELRDKIASTLGASALLINHIGSSSVPGLPAKPVIDIDLVVADLEDEASYVPALEGVGFHFLLREPEWFGHRFFCDYAPVSCNLHVFGALCPEVERHRIFRDRLLTCDEDRELYARTKKEAMAEILMRGETLAEYNKRKEEVIRQILKRAFQSLGYL